MFRPAKWDLSIQGEAEDAVLAVDELRGSCDLQAERDRHRNGTSSSRDRLTAITTPALAKRLESVATATVLVRDSLSLDALLTDLVFPLVPLKPDHQSTLISCVVAAVIPDEANHARDRRILSSILSKVAKICNRTPIPSQLEDGAWSMFATVSDTRIVARALMIWIKESLFAPNVKDSMDYEM